MNRHVFIVVASVLIGPLARPAAAGQAPQPQQTPPPQPGPAARAAGPSLTLKDAQDLALKNHPRVLAAENAYAASGELVREARSAYYPILAGEVTGAQGNGDDNARIGAGTGLSASRLFDRFGDGVLMSQLITDLGRTQNLVASTKDAASASQQNVEASRQQVLLDVNGAFYGVLRAQGVLRVAQQTVDARQLLRDQVNTLAQNNLRSQLDVSFADVNLADAKLLLIQAQSDVDTAYADLARAIGSDTPVQYQLAEEPLPPSPPTTVDSLLAGALVARPDLARLRFERDAAQKFSYAERDLSRPTVGLVAAAGFLPYSSLPGTPIADKYEGVAVNVDIPVFNGGLFGARHAAAEYRALEAENMFRDLEDQISRDVRVVWARTTTAYQRLDVTAQFLQSATLALNLAQGRYNLGLSSIVELTQAQLNVTRAEIENLSAKYDYQNESAALQYAIGQIK